MTESNLNERCFGKQSGEGNYNYYIQPKGTTATGRKGMDFFRGHYGHTKGIQLGNSRHYQVLVKLWMRDWWSVCSLRKKQSRAHVFHTTFFIYSLESHHAALQLIQTFKDIAQHLFLSSPAHSKLFILCVGWGVIVTWVGHLGEFVCLWWPDMVPNQRQLFIVVSDWGSYLGSHFPMVISGLLSTFSCLRAHQ